MGTEGCVTTSSVSLRCRTEDGSRSPEVGLQERASNRAVLPCSKDKVVSDRGKGIQKGCQVSVEKMSESKPSDDASLFLKALPKLGMTIGSRNSRDETCLRS